MSWRLPTSCSRVSSIPADHHPFSQFGELVEISPTPRSSPRSRTSPRSAPTTGSSSPTRAAGSRRRRCTTSLRALARRPARHRGVHPRPHRPLLRRRALRSASAAEHGLARAAVLAHEAITARFDRYRETAGYNGIINQRQFQLAAPTFPTEFRYPDETFRDRARPHGRRRDASSATTHAARPTTTSGSGCPSGRCSAPVTSSSGRRRTAATRRRCSATRSSGRARCGRWPRSTPRSCCRATACRSSAPTASAPRSPTSAALLEHLHTETIRMMNEGAAPRRRSSRPSRAPADLLDRPYLGPIYDEPEFVIRNVWRLFGGWYDGDPSHLKPPPTATFAGEVAELAGGARALAARAEALADARRPAPRRAPRRARGAGRAATTRSCTAPAPTSTEQRVAAEASVMAQGVFAWAASASRNGRVEAADAGDCPTERSVTGRLGRMAEPVPTDRRGPIRARRRRPPASAGLRADPHRRARSSG